MKRAILIAGALAFSTAAFAQTSQSTSPTSPTSPTNSAAQGNNSTTTSGVTPAE